jgi:hypothetical protein
VGLPRILPLFVLPRLPRSARVLGDLDSWREGLELAQIELSEGRADVVVAPASRTRDAVAVGAESLVIEGRARVTAGYTAQTVLALPGVEEPEVLVPAGRPGPVAYAFANRQGLRARLARPLLARGLVPPPASPTVVASLYREPPAFVAAAAELLPGPVDSWLPVLGRWGDPFSRGVLLLFAPGAVEPGWALKFARVPGNERPFNLDEQGLGAAAAAGGIAAAHAPRLLGRFAVGRLAASVETAIPGGRLLPVLTGGAPRAEKLAAVERIAGWIEGIARETRGGPVRDTKRARVAAAAGAARGLDLLSRLDGVPSVLEHADIWPDNVVVGRDSFGLLDWEAADAAGMPLWDLFYFLTGALAFVDGTRSEDEQEEHFVQLHRGELPSSPFLFEWTRRVAAATQVPDEAVGALATLRLVQLAAEDLTHGKRTAAVGAAGGVPLSVRQLERWLADAMLGPGWDRWQA